MSTSPDAAGSRRSQRRRRRHRQHHLPAAGADRALGDRAGQPLRRLGRRAPARARVRPRRVLRAPARLRRPALDLAALGRRLPRLLRAAGRSRPRHRLDPHRRRPLRHLRERPRGGPGDRRQGPPRPGRGGRRPDRRRRARLPRPRRRRSRRAGPVAGAGGRGGRSRTRAGLDMWFCLDTLEYLRKGGRIGAAQALVGSALKIKPILTFGTEIAPVGRVRTKKRAMERMVAYLHELHERGAERLDRPARPVPRGRRRPWSPRARRSSAPSPSSAPRSAPCSAPTSAPACWSAASAARPPRTELRTRVRLALGPDRGSLAA